MKASLSSEDVARVSEDLSQCRTRIDAGVEENKKNRQVIEDLNHQLKLYRQRAAAETSATSSPGMLPIVVQPPGGSSHYEPRIRHKSLGRLEHPTSSSSQLRVDVPLHRSSPRLTTGRFDRDDDDDIEDLYARLKSELFKNNTLEEVNEMLREENDAAIAANENLRVDVAQLHKQLQMLEQQQLDDQTRFRSENTRYRNQVENQHRKLISLWKAFTTVKRQVNELKTSAANDLDRQMTEFTRCATLMQRAIRHAEEKNRSLQNEMKKEKDDVLEETLKQLSTATENFVKAEEKANERNRELRRVGDELKKTREEADELRDAVAAVSRLARTSPQRTRSISPVSSREDAMDVARKMRKLLTSKNAEVAESQEAARRAEVERDRARKELDKEEKRRRSERDTQNQRSHSLAQREADLKRLEDDLKKANEKIRNLEEQREQQEKLFLSTQDALADAHRIHKTFIENLMKQHSEELESRQEMHRDELRQRSEDERLRQDKDRVEKERSKRDTDELLEAQRQLKAELATMSTVLEDKSLRLELLEDETEAQKKRLAEERALIDQRELEMQELRQKMDEMIDKEADLRKELAEAQSVESVMQAETKQHQEETMHLRDEISTLQQRVDTLQADLEEHNADTENLLKSIAEKDEQIQAFSSNVLQLNSSVAEANGESSVFKSEIDRLHEQVQDKNRQIAEITGKLEDVKRNAEILHDDLNVWQTKADGLKVELEEAEKQGRAKDEQGSELRTLLEDFRVNFDKLTNEGKQKSITIDSLSEELETLKEEIKRKENNRKEELARASEQEKQREEELQAVFDEKLSIAERQKKELEKVVDEAEGRLEQLTKIHEELMGEVAQLRMTNDALKEEVEEAKRIAKRDLDKAMADNEGDREEWTAERQKLESSKNALVNELNERIAELEEEVRTRSAREDDMKKDAGDLRDTLDVAEAKLLASENRIAEMKEDQVALEKSMTEQKSLLTEEKENALLEAIKQTSQVEQLKRKIGQLDAEIEKLATNVADRESSIQALEQNTIELLTQLEDVRKTEQGYKDELAVFKKQSVELKSSKESALKKLVDEKKLNEDLGEQVRQLNKGLHSLKLKTLSGEERKNEAEQQISVLSNKVRQLEIQLVDKTTKSEISNDLMKKMEQDAHSMVKELENERKRMNSVTRHNVKLEETNRQLDGELQATKGALESKRESSQAAINDLLQQYRKAEEKANDMALENQKLRSETQTIALKLDRMDKTRRELEHRARESESKATEAQAKLHNFQRSAVDQLAYPHNLPPKSRSPNYVEIPRSVSSIALNDSNTSVDLPRPPSVRFSEGVPTLDVSSSVGVTLRFLKERIEQLEVDKAELTATLENQKVDMKERTEKLREAIFELERSQRSVADLQNERTSLASRVSSQRQMYLTNEEYTRAKDHDLRTLKARIATLELHLREKDSKIGQLKEELTSLQAQLQDVQAAKSRVASVAASREERFRENEEEFDKVVKERDEAAVKLRRLQAEHENLTRRLEQGENERTHLVREVSQERRAAQRNRDLVAELRNNEKQWKSTANHAKRSVDDEQRKVAEQRRVEQNLHDLNSRNEALSGECDRLRAELRDFVHKVNHLNLKAVDSDRKSEELASKNALLTQNVNALRKFEEEWRNLEREMREELKQLRKEKLALTAESEDWKRRTLRIETEKKEIDAIRVRLEREIAALKKHVDALEEDKNRTELAVRDTLNERKAIDKSLAAMERENTQLYRNCSQLQSQITQLERDAGSRSVAKLAKEHAQLETKIATLLDEKRQLQAMLDQKEANYAHKRKLMDSQMALLREQLDAERRRRLQKEHSRRTDASPAPSRRAVQTTAFRYERSISCERTMVEQQQLERLLVVSSYHETPPISPMSYADSVASGTLIM